MHFQIQRYLRLNLCCRLKRFCHSRHILSGQSEAFPQSHQLPSSVPWLHLCGSHTFSLSNVSPGWPGLFQTCYLHSPGSSGISLLPVLIIGEMAFVYQSPYSTIFISDSETRAIVTLTRRMSANKDQLYNCSKHQNNVCSYICYGEI